MSDYESVLYAASDRVAQITMNRPDAMNSFNASLRRDLAAALQRAGTDPDARVVVLSGAGRVFGAGADLKEGFAVSTTDQVNFEYRPVFDAIADMRKPVISAIGGSASGISLSVAMTCDLSVMADDAFLLSPFTTISLVPDGGAHFLLGRQIGYKRAYEMIAEAQRVPAAKALEWGLVNKIVPAAELMDVTLAWAGELAKRAPLALAASKKLLRLAMNAGYDQVYRAEAEVQQTCIESADAKEGIQAFLGKRAPDFKGK